MARLNKQQKIEKAIEDILNQMFIIAGHNVTYNDIKGRKDHWWADMTMTMAQTEEWKQWSIAYLRKELKMNKILAEREMMWINLMWGLKNSDYKL